MKKDVKTIETNSKKVATQSKNAEKNIKPAKLESKELKPVAKTQKKVAKNVAKTTKAERYSKIKIVEFVKDLKDNFKQYKNIEKLKIVDQLEDKLPKMKTNEDYFICENQNQKLVIKSGFMLDYGYKKLSKGFFVPVDRDKVLAIKTSKNIVFSDSFGSTTKLKAGDYVVIQKKNIIGMKRSEFEENYALLNKANKILKTYDAELAK